MFKEDKLKDLDRERFMSHFPFEGDTTLQILKGHLLVEEHIRQLVTLQLPNPKALTGSDGASYDCHQMICLAEAITAESNQEQWVWKALKKLNKLRNFLAHNLHDGTALSHKVEDMVAYLKHHASAYREFEKTFSQDQSDTRLILCIMCINTKLVSLKKLVAERQD